MWRLFSVVIEDGIGGAKSERRQYKVRYGSCDNFRYRGEHCCRCKNGGRGMTDVATRAGGWRWRLRSDVESDQQDVDATIGESRSVYTTAG